MASTKPTTTEPAAELFLTVAICTRNRADFLQRAIESVRPQLTDDAELIVVDNASTDCTADVAARAAASHPRIKVFYERETGLSVARNRCLAEAAGRYVIFLDDDAVAENGWLKAYRDFLSGPATSQIAVVGGAVFPEYEFPPPAWLSRKANRLDLGGTARRVSACGGPWGGNSAYRRDAALQAGGFDARLGRKGGSLASSEETELNERLEQAGSEIWWLPGAGIRHFIGAARLTLRWAARCAFMEGRSTAIQRMKTRGHRLARLLYGAGRFVVAPVQVVVALLAALVTLPFVRSVAASQLFRACRTCGFAWQLLVLSPGNESAASGA